MEKEPTIVFYASIFFQRKIKRSLLILMQMLIWIYHTSKINCDLDLENNLDDIMEESIWHNVGTDLVDKSFEKSLSRWGNSKYWFEIIILLNQSSIKEKIKKNFSFLSQFWSRFGNQDIVKESTQHNVHPSFIHKS